MEQGIGLTALGIVYWAVVLLAMLAVVRHIFESVKYLRFRRLPRTIAELVLCPHRICPPVVDHLTLEQWRANAHDYGTYPSIFDWLEEHGLPRKSFERMEPDGIDHAMCYECHELLSLETDEIIEIHTARTRTYCNGCWHNFIRPRWRRYLRRKLKGVWYLRLMNNLYGLLSVSRWPERYRVDTWLQFYADDHIMRSGRTHWSHVCKHSAQRRGSALLTGV